MGSGLKFTVQVIEKGPEIINNQSSFHDNRKSAR